MILVFLSFFIVFQEFRQYRTDVDNLIAENNDMGESFLSQSLNDSEMDRQTGHLTVSQTDVWLTDICQTGHRKRYMSFMYISIHEKLYKLNSKQMLKSVELET